MRLTLFIFGLILSFSVHAGAPSIPAQQQNFAEALAASDWPRVKTFTHAGSKCGFGPFDEGTDCVQQLYADDAQCRQRFINVLASACTRQRHGDVEFCYTPHEYTAEQARVGFEIMADGRLRLHALICGGD